jgi:hypothetical protein
LTFKLALKVFFIQFLLILLYEFGILSKIIGYSDWDLYRRILSNGSGAPGFIQLLNIFHMIFNNFAIFFWYLTQLLFNTYFLSKFLTITKKTKSLKYFTLYNPFFIIFYSGIFKEVILLNVVIWASLNINFFKKVISFFFYLLIRIHLTPFILLIITRFSFLMYLLFGFIIFYFVNYYNVIDYRFINASVSEINTFGKGDLPISILFNFSIPIIINNILVVLFAFIYASKFLIKILYFFTIFYILYFYITNKLFKSFLIFLLGLLPYSFILTNSGTALRIITFLFVISISNYYISKYNNDK